MKFMQNYYRHKFWNKTTWTVEKKCRKDMEVDIWETGCDEGKVNETRKI
jgi:hypothetical protein